MTFGYNADATFGQSTVEVVNHAKSLLASLVDKREEPEVHCRNEISMGKKRLTHPQETNRPLIFIAHSLGGIVVKQVWTTHTRGFVVFHEN